MTEKEFDKKVKEMFDETKRIIDWRRKDTQRKIDAIKIRYGYYNYK